MTSGAGIGLADEAASDMAADPFLALLPELADADADAELFFSSFNSCLLTLGFATKSAYFV